jgi:hypothetical protein
MTTHFNKAKILALGCCLASLLCGGCFYSHTDKVVPAPVATEPPAETTTTVIRQPAVSYSAIPPQTEQTTTTRWDNGTVVQKQTKTDAVTGTVQKQTTTTWGSEAGSPSQTTTSTTAP